MTVFKRLFMIDGESGGWSNTTRTGFIISLDNDNLSVKHKFGREMYVEEINTAFGRFLKEYEAEFGKKIALYERYHQYRFCFRQGISGCQDTYIEIDKNDGFPERKFIMHESCFGKCGGFDCFAYDFLDLCLASGFFKIEDGSYAYSEAEDANVGCEMQIIKPRMTEYEEGWTHPSRRPDEVVYLKVVREVPSEEE